MRVRARRREHLADTFELFDDQVIDLGVDAPDYRFHADVPRVNVAHAIYDAILAIDYDSHVKENVAGNDHVMYSAMLGCWRELYRLQDEPLDTTSSASRQHYIDTGRYLPETSDALTTLGDLDDLAGQIGTLADKMRAVGPDDRPLAEQECRRRPMTTTTTRTRRTSSVAVIAQCEDLSRSEALEVLAQARAAVEGWDR